MTQFHSEDAIEAYLDSQFQVREQVSPEAGEPAPRFVTISRETGAGGVALAELLAAELNSETSGGGGIPWTVFDKNLVEVVIREHALPERFSQYLAEDAFPELRGILDDLFGIEPSVSSTARRTAQTILRLAILGNAILVGRGANLISRKLDGGLHVRLISPLRHRVSQIMGRERLERAEAERFVKKQDEAKRKYVRDHFNRDVGDPLLYDLVLNTAGVTLRRAVKTIRTALEHAR
jgi:hypothetical protein